jgi:hypothetical protein
MVFCKSRRAVVSVIGNEDAMRDFSQTLREIAFPCRRRPNDRVFTHGGVREHAADASSARHLWGESLPREGITFALTGQSAHVVPTRVIRNRSPKQEGTVPIVLT